MSECRRYSYIGIALQVRTNTGSKSVRNFRLNMVAMEDVQEIEDAVAEDVLRDHFRKGRPGRGPDGVRDVESVVQFLQQFYKRKGMDWMT